MKMIIKSNLEGAVSSASPARLGSSQSGSCCARAGCSQRELTWVDLINRYPSPRECLAAFVVSTVAEVIAGVKPARGFISGKSRPWQGRCLWRIYGPPGRSLQIYQRFRAERQAINRRIVAGNGPIALLLAS